jgi:hypothetical protein
MTSNGVHSIGSVSSLRLPIPLPGPQSCISTGSNSSRSCLSSDCGDPILPKSVKGKSGRADLHQYHHISPCQCNHRILSGRGSGSVRNVAPTEASMPKCDIKIGLESPHLILRNEFKVSSFRFIIRVIQTDKAFKVRRLCRCGVRAAARV